MSLISEVIIQAICAIIAACVILIHSFRLYYLSKHGPSKLKSFQLCKINTKNLFMMLLILVFILGVKDFIQSLLNYQGIILSLSVCNIFIKSQISGHGLARFLSHLFVAVRAQLNRKQISSVWQKFGFVMLSVDLFLTAFVWAPQSQIISHYSASGTCDFVFSLIIPILYAISDLIIGSYCLFIFVIPLRKYIAIERENCDSSDLAMIVKRVMIWSSFSLISTMLAILIVMIENNAAVYVYPIDLTFNAFCTSMQFRDIPRQLLPQFVRKMIEYIQCKCFHKEMIKNRLQLTLSNRAKNVASPETESKADSTKKISVLIQNYSYVVYIYRSVYFILLIIFTIVNLYVVYQSWQNRIAHIYYILIVIFVIVFCMNFSFYRLIYTFTVLYQSKKK
eukprot:2255_1